MLGAFVRELGVSALEAILPVAVIPKCVLGVVLARMKAAKLARVQAVRAAEAQRRAKKRLAMRTAGRGMGAVATSAGPRRARRPAHGGRREREVAALVGQV